MSTKDDRSARMIARSKRRKAGDRSARIANALMKLKPEAVRKVVPDEDLQEAVARAQAITSLIARRRAERTLAGELRRYDLVEIDERLSKVHESDNADQELFHQAEQWRARLIEDAAALAEFPGVADDELPRLIDAARRERDTGKPPGAGKKLFRYVAEALREPPITDDEAATATADADNTAAVDADDDPA
jgi:ribosome-associated protein